MSNWECYGWSDTFWLHGVCSSTSEGQLWRYHSCDVAPVQEYASHKLDWLVPTQRSRRREWGHELMLIQLDKHFPNQLWWLANGTFQLNFSRCGWRWRLFRFGPDVVIIVTEWCRSFGFASSSWIRSIGSWGRDWDDYFRKTVVSFLRQLKICTVRHGFGIWGCCRCRLNCLHNNVLCHTHSFVLALRTG